MAPVKKDKYELGQSTKKTLQDLAQEIRIDLSLKPSSNLNGGTIFGKVTDDHANPVADALIKIMDKDHNPLAHTISGADGSYTFSPFPPSTEYHLYAIKPGYSLSELTPFPLADNQSVEKNIAIIPDPNAKFSIIAGDINNNTKPIKGAAVNLYSIDKTGAKTLLTVTFSNEYGQYVFRDLGQGEYLVTISALGYKTTSISVTIDKDSMIIKSLTNVDIDPEASKGTISGIITDDKNNPIADADVILYSVGEDGTLTPIAYTKTNDEGLYLFIRVPQGDYKVKSNQTVVV